MADSETPCRGFILQPTYRILEGRPVVHLHGRLEEGGSFLVQDDRETPHFYVGAADAEEARALGAVHLRESRRRDFRGRPVVRVEVERPADTPPLRDRLRRQGIRCYEADVRFAMRYLIDRGIRGSLELSGPWSPGDGIDRVYHNPEVAPGSWTPTLTVLSLDIETDPSVHRLLSVGLHGCGAAEVHLLTRPRDDCPPGAVPYPSAGRLLEGVVARIRELDPDVLTGWHVEEFDLVVLHRVAESTGVRLALGRDGGPLRLRRLRGGDATQAVIPGRLVLDGLKLLRGAFVRMERYSLDHVARTVLGHGKTLRSPDRGREILRLFKQDRPRFVEYNLTDARLVLEILERLRLVELAVERSRLTGMPPDRVSASIASFDFLYLSELHRLRVVAPSVEPGVGSGSETAGGHVLEPRQGLYRNVLVFDFQSLYPSLIRTFQLDPLGYLGDAERAREEGVEDAIVAPNGAHFRRRRGILTGLLDELVPRRAEARRQGDAVTSQAIKILMNSFYGVLATPACRFYNSDLANAITSFGRSLLLWARDRLEDLGYPVLYGDTDSLFVESGAADPAAARALGRELAERLNRDLAAYIRETWSVESRMELDLETLYLRLLLPPARRGGAARKRYAGLVEGGNGPRVVFTGLESVRRDWTELARQVQRGLYERFFTDRPVERYLRRQVEALREGELDELLVYRKALRKSPEEYTATTPPHVAAARKLEGRPPRVMAYVMTLDGPEPAAERKSPPDYEHYVDRQLRPVAEPVLEELGLRFDKVVGDDRQMELF